MTPTGSQVLIDHSPAVEIRPVSLPEYSAEDIMQTRGTWFTSQELQSHNNTRISARLKADLPQVCGFALLAICQNKEMCGFVFAHTRKKIHPL